MKPHIRTALRGAVAALLAVAAATGHAASYQNAPVSAAPALGQVVQRITLACQPWTATIVGTGITDNKVILTNTSRATIAANRWVRWAEHVPGTQFQHKGSHLLKWDFAPGMSVELPVTSPVGPCAAWAEVTPHAAVPAWRAP